MAITGMTLGLTSIVAVHLVSAQVARQLDELVPEPLTQFSHTAQREDMTSSDYFELRRRHMDMKVMPVIDERIILQGQWVRVVGVDLLRVSLAELSTAQPDETSVGDVMTGVFAGTEVPDTGRPVLGRLDWPGVLIADIGVAQEILGWQDSDRLSYLGLNIASPWSQALLQAERFFPGVSAGFPPLVGPQLSGFQVQPSTQQNPAQSFGKSVLFNVSALGALSLVVAWFLIYQVAVFWVRRLQDVFNRLFVLGVERQLLLFYFVGLLVFVGLVATIAGLSLGLLLATELMRASGLPDIVLTLDRWVVIKALASALVVCVFGGAWSFRRVVDTTPIDFGRWRLVGLFTMALVTLVGLVVPATDLFGGFLSIALLSVFLAFSIAPVLGYVRRASRFVSGPLLLRMSVREVVWYPRDLSIALAGLSLAIASAIGVGLMVDSFRAEFATMLKQRLSYDYVVEGQAEELQDLHTALVGDAGVTRSRLYWQQNIRSNHGPIEVLVTEVDESEARRYGYTQPLAEGQVLVSEQWLQQAPGVSDRTSEALLAGKAFDVVGVFKSFGDLTPRVISSEPLPGVPAQILELRVDAPAQIAQRWRDEFPQTSWQDQRVIEQNALRTFDQTFTITSILIAIAIGVGGIGVYVAVTVLRLNQRASTKLLTFMGLSAREQLGIDFARGAGVGSAACCFAIPLGIALGWILCAVINPRAFGWWIDMQITPSALLTPLGWGLFAATVAGLVRVGLSEGDIDA